MSSSSQRLSRESLSRLLDAAQRPRNPKRVTHQQLQRYLTQWFPPGLWASIYRDADLQQRDASSTRQSNPFQRLCRDPSRVSVGWMAALELLALSRLVTDAPITTPPTNAPAHPRAPPSSSTSAVHTVEHLLQFAVLPPAGWAVSLTLLEAWRAEQQHQTHNSSTAPPPQHHKGERPMKAPPQPSFPPSLSAPAAAQLLHHISLAPPSMSAWRDALLLYQRSAAAAYAASPEHRHQPPATRAAATAVDGVVPASSAFLKALRHMCLTTLLQAGEWERGLHFYFHSLYQRDLPGTVTTGYLVQALGKAGQWAAVLQVYDLCVRLLAAQRAARVQRQPPQQETPSREWGTTLSMAMAAVQHCPTAPPTALMSMVAQLQRTAPPDGPSSASTAAAAPLPATALPPLVQLDGNFLSAVQALPSGEGRVAVLRVAREEGMLDTFKLIRGLVSQQRWGDALLLFTEAMRGAPRNAAAALESGEEKKKDHPQRQPSALFLTRREVGEARRNLLHGASLPNVAAVVAVLNRYRPEMAAAGEKGRHRSGNHDKTREASLTLNDQEVECVLSKTLEATHAGVPLSDGAADFWRYCLQVLDHNYGTAYTQPAAAKATKAAAAHTANRARHVRRPTTAALSFLLRHPRLPWHVALRLVDDFGLLDPAQGGAEPPRRGSTRFTDAAASAETVRGSPNVIVTPRALALSAVVACLAAQGQQAAAEALACRALDSDVAAAAAAATTRAASQRGVSIPASLLQVVSPTTLWDLLLLRRHSSGDGLFVDGRVLFHLLRESTRCASPEQPSVLSNVDAFFQHPCGRALTVVHALLQRRIAAAPAGGCDPLLPLSATEAVRRLPAGLFLCEGAASGMGEERRTSIAAAATSGSTSASDGSTLPPWLLAYPSSVHCEVLRVVQCVTTSAHDVGLAGTAAPSSVGTEAAASCAVWRWTWTLRYLHVLAQFFTEPQNRRGRGTRPSDAVAEAHTAYYVATFEAVVGLLDTSTVPDCTDRSSPLLTQTETSQLHHGGEGGDALDMAVPRTSQQRVTALCHLVERAVARYDCLPPTHMLLPNQLDRLLPPLVKSAASSTASNEPASANLRWGGADADAAAGAGERCAVAMHLIYLTLQALEASPTAAGVDAESTARVEPPLLNNLLKLCCRVAEYGQAMSQGKPPPDAAGEMDGAALCQAGERLVRLQCERCGFNTVRSSTVTLLFHLCAAAQSTESKTPSLVPRKVALRVTDYLLRHQQQQRRMSAPERGRYRSEAAVSDMDMERQGRQWSRRDTHQRGGGAASSPAVAAAAASAAVVQTHHCELFFSLFGWEESLAVWYPAFPRYVLNLLAHTPQAVEACLSMEERKDR